MIALPDEDDSASILDNLNLVLHPSDPKSSLINSITYDEDEQVVLQGPSHHHPEHVQHTAATIIQRHVREWLQARRELN